MEKYQLLAQKRRYFMTADRRLRATIDTGQQAFDQRQGALGRHSKYMNALRSIAMV